MKPFFFNKCFEKNNLKALVAWSLLNFKERKTLDLVEKLKNLGYIYATQAGASLGIDDLKTPPTKSWLISEADLQTRNTKKEYYKGNLTAVENYQQLIDTWQRTSDLLKKDVQQNFESTDILNPVYMMAFTGARGNMSQVHQLVGMRGLMADPQGEIIDYPIKSNFREGITLTEYLISCYGARKGLVDTALRTANAGYLTRRLVDVAQHIIIGCMDCGTTRAISMGDMKDGEKTILLLKKRLIGRVLAEDIQPVALRNQQISLALASQIANLRKTVLVRSPLTCRHKKFLCQFCYGWSLSSGNLVGMGEAVGVLAAQAIGEPGTQLTMRTFHTGGVFSGGGENGVSAPFDGIVRYTNSLPGQLIRTSFGQIVFFTKEGGEISLEQIILPQSPSYLKVQKQKASETTYLEPTGPKIFYENLSLTDLESSKSINQNSYEKKENDFRLAKTEKFSILKFSVLFIRNVEKVSKGQLIASPVVSDTKSLVEAEHRVNAEIAGQIWLKSNKTRGLARSLWILAGKFYKSPSGSPLFFKKGDFIGKKAILNQSTGLTTNNGLISPIKIRKNEPCAEARSVFDQYLSDGKKISSCCSKKIDNKRENNFLLILKQPLQKFLIETPKYKKLGYFFSLDKKLPGTNVVSATRDKENNTRLSISCLPRSKGTANTFFTTASLKEKINRLLKKDRFDLSNKSVLYKWFLKNHQTKSGGLLLSSKSNSYLFDKVLFWLDEESYKVPYSNFFSPNSTKAVWSSLETPFFYEINRQAKKKPTFIKKSGFFQFTNNNSLLALQGEKAKSRKKAWETRSWFKYYTEFGIPSYIKSGFLLPKGQSEKKRRKLSKQILIAPVPDIFNGFCLKGIITKGANSEIKLEFIRNLNDVQINTLSIRTKKRNSDLCLGAGTNRKVVSFSKERARNPSFLYKMMGKQKFYICLSEKDSTVFLPESEIKKKCYGSKTLRASAQGSFESSTTRPLSKPLLNQMNQTKAQISLCRRGLIFANILPEKIEGLSKILSNEFLPKVETDGQRKFRVYVRLSFFKNFGLKKSCSSKVFNLFPFFAFFQSNAVKNKNFNLCSASKTMFYKGTGQEEKSLFIPSKKIKVKYGWVYFPKEEKKIVKDFKKLNKIDNIEIDNIVFDQQIIYAECLKIFYSSNLCSAAGKRVVNGSMTFGLRGLDFLRNSKFNSFLNIADFRRAKTSLNIFTIQSINCAFKNRVFDIKAKYKKGLVTSTFCGEIVSTTRKVKASDKRSLTRQEKILIWSKTPITPIYRGTNKIFGPVKFKFKIRRNNLIVESSRKSIDYFLIFALNLEHLDAQTSFVPRVNSSLLYPKVLKNNEKQQGKENLSPLYLDFLPEVVKLLFTFFNFEPITETTSPQQSTFNSEENDALVSQKTNLQQLVRKKFLLKKPWALANYEGPEIEIRNPWVKNNLQIITNYNKVDKKYLRSIKTLLKSEKIKQDYANIFLAQGSSFNIFFFGKSYLLPCETLFHTPFLYSKAQVTDNIKLGETSFNLDFIKKNTSKSCKLNKTISSTALDLWWYNRFCENAVQGVYQPQFLLLFRKITSYPLLDLRQYKKTIYSTTKKEIFFDPCFYDLQKSSILSSNFTAQKETFLFSSTLSNELQIQLLLPLGLNLDQLTFKKYEHSSSENECRKVQQELVSAELGFSKKLESDESDDLDQSEDLAKQVRFFNKTVLQQITISLSPNIHFGLNAVTTQIKATRLKLQGIFEKTLFVSTYTYSAFGAGNIKGSEQKFLAISNKVSSDFSPNKLLPAAEQRRVESLQLTNLPDDSIFSKSEQKKKETWISTNRPTVLTDFLSPYKGEIAQSGSKSSFILVTNSDQITVSTLFGSSALSELTGSELSYGSDKNSTNLLPFETSFNQAEQGKAQTISVGELVRSGEEIVRDAGLKQSGQVIKLEAGKITLRRAHPVLLTQGSFLNLGDNSFVEKNDQLFTLKYQVVKTGDIVQGIPKIEQLFEARGPLIEGRVEHKTQLVDSGLSAEFLKIYLNYAKNFSNKIAVRKSFEYIQENILQKVYLVYQEQGVYLAEKHLEIIVRQMTSFILIVNPGSTQFLSGEIVPLAFLERANLAEKAYSESFTNGFHPASYAQYKPVLLGITKAALRSKSFISAASFQETTRVLSQAAIEKRTDYLRGLKENVVLGRVIPAGTGFPLWRWRKAVYCPNTPKRGLQSVTSRSYYESFDTLTF